MREHNSSYLYFSFVPLAAALGSKQTAFLFLPFYLLVLLILLLRKRLSARIVFTAAGVFAACFALLASYKFIQNAVERDRMTSSMFASHRYRLPFSQPGDWLRYATNGSRYLYQAASADGLTGRVKLSALDARANAFIALSGWFNLDLEVRDYISEGDEEYFSYAEAPALNEDSAWFGPLAFLLFPVVMIAVLAGTQTLSVVFSRFPAHCLFDGCGAHHRLEPNEWALPDASRVGVHSAFRRAHSSKARLERISDACPLSRHRVFGDIHPAHQ